MSDHTHIEWTDATWNPVTGCSVVSPGCTNCYAMRLAGTRLKHIPSRKGLTIDTKAGPVWNGEVRFNREWLTQPLKWKRPRMIFVCAHGDLFHENVPDEWIDRIFAVMALSPQHTFQVLTKRSARMREYLDARTAEIKTNLLSSTIGNLLVAYHASTGSPYPGNARFELVSNADHIASHPEDEQHQFKKTAGWPLPNVWLGVSVEDQTRADARIPDLLATPAVIRFISAEPLLGAVDLTFLDPENMYRLDALNGCHGVTEPLAGENSRLDWVIVGGESGNGARPMRPDWARSLRDQCAAAGVAFFFKQHGEWIDADQWLDLVEAGPSQLFVSGERWRPASPLSFAAAERLACLTGRMCNGEPVIERNSDGTTMIKVGKQAAGRLLDGVEHNGMPEVQA